MKYDFPKLDLHYHLDGSMDPETTFRLAQERNITLPVNSAQELAQFFKDTADCDDVGQYLARFDMLTAILQDKPALTETTYASIKNIADMLDYVEIRFAPQLHTHKGISQKDAIDAVLEGKRKAEKDFPQIKVKIILCMMISFKDNEKENQETARLFEQYYGNEVVGLDLAGFEDSVPMDNYAHLFESAKSKGLNLTIHGGDNGLATNPAKVIGWGAKRVGHGHHCYYDKETMQKVIDTKTALEICLSSNIQCKTEPSFSQHPAKKLLDSGVKVTLCTDNMILANTTIEKEYDIAMQQVGFSYNDLVQCAINGFEASFMSEQEKQPYLEKLAKAFK